MAANAEKTFEGLTPNSLAGPFPEPTMHTIAFEDLLNVTTHLATHTGQIVWIAKMLNEGAVDEVWITSHRAEGEGRGERCVAETGTARLGPTFQAYLPTRRRAV